MKHVRRLVFAAMLLLFAAPAWAYDFEVDGICYNITSNAAPYEVSVTSKGSTNPYSGNVTIPETVSYEGISYSVTSIGRVAFYECTGLSSITIPNSVTNIGKGAFYGCKNLTSVTIPNSVRSIGGGAFGCSGLSSISIPNSVTSIGGGCILGVPGLELTDVAQGLYLLRIETSDGAVVNRKIIKQ